jgi:hypothetical protein
MGLSNTRYREVGTPRKPPFRLLRIRFLKSECIHEISCKILPVESTDYTVILGGISFYGFLLKKTSPGLGPILISYFII